MYKVDHFAGRVIEYFMNKMHLPDMACKIDDMGSNACPCLHADPETRYIERTPPGLVSCDRFVSPRWRAFETSQLSLFPFYHENFQALPQVTKTLLLVI